MDKDFINRKINQITKNGTLTNLYEIAESNNIIIYEDYWGSATAGAYHFVYRIKIIMLNTALSYFHKMIVLAHEIAHAIIHPYEEANFSLATLSKNTKENEANYFACRLLDAIGFWDNEDLCIYEHEMSKSDKGFIDIYKNYVKGGH